MNETPARQEDTAVPEEHELLARLSAIERQLEQTQRLVTLGTLAAGVAHDINNILTPVLSYAHLVKSQGDDAQLLAKAMNKIIAGIQSACAVAQSTLNYSQDRDEDEVADVAEVLQAALGCLARDPAKDGVTVRSRIQPDTVVHMRPLALQQALLNLILNARTALKGRGGTVVVETAEHGSHSTRIEVIDDGPGIPADVLERLFEPFVSTNSNQALFDRNTVGGAGLGLTVTRHLVERAGGTIDVRSTLGKGATFTIVVPSARPVRAKAS